MFDGEFASLTAMRNTKTVLQVPRPIKVSQNCGLGYYDIYLHFYLYEVWYYM